MKFSSHGSDYKATFLEYDSMPFVTNALEELAASIFRTDYANGRFSP